MSVSIQFDELKTTENINVCFSKMFPLLSPVLLSFSLCYCFIDRVNDFFFYYFFWILFLFLYSSLLSYFLFSAILFFACFFFPEIFFFLTYDRFSHDFSIVTSSLRFYLNHSHLESTLSLTVIGVKNDIGLSDSNFKRWHKNKLEKVLIHFFFSQD